MIRIRQLKIDIRKDSLDSLKKKIINILKISEKELKDFYIIKKSIDARDKNNIVYTYEVNASLVNEKIIKYSKDIFKVKEEKYKSPVSGDKILKHRPIIVGAGPCGLFCALILAENGYKPIVIERGERIEERVKSVERFWEKDKLNPNSNVCFGEGGAGTFSDGKLNTLVNDENNRIKKVFDTFITCGAPKEIAYLNKPHIGTNILREVIINLRKKIISLGGEILYKTCLTDIGIKDEKIENAVVNNERIIDCDCLILALGHSARDTIGMLYNHNLKMKPIPFAVGIRIQHKQEMISKSQYGESYKLLPPASYKLTYKASNGRGVYTFCMCPGGFVVNSSCEDGHLIINGMSNYEREGENANSAVVVTVDANDYGGNPLDGVEYQRNLEACAYKLGNGKIPVQLWKDYKNNVISSKFQSIKPQFKGKYCFANLNELFPKYINDSLKEAIPNMGTKIKGFDSDDAIIAGVESRTSSAVRIIRDNDFNSNIRGIYPAGEGAGYSGGIITSAVDGIKIAEKIIEKYRKISI